jgi:hypothetical protein
MPKQSLIHSPRGAAYDFVHVIELSQWEIFKMLLGREVDMITAEGKTVIRCGVCYEAFNLSAPRDEHTFSLSKSDYDAIAKRNKP